MNNNITSLRPIHATTALSDWQKAINALDLALTDYNQHRALLAATEDDIEVFAALTLLSTEGKNEAERKARLAVALDEDANHRLAVKKKHMEQDAVRDAERHVTIAKERCRLARATLQLLVVDDHDLPAA
jgi:hypothetical protein